MWEGEYPELDSDKGQWLLDIAAYRQWQIDQHNNGQKQVKLTPLDKERYQQLREIALKLYKQLCREAQDTSHTGRIRLFKYLSGETLEEIAEDEIPPVTRQAIHKSLKQILKGVTTEQARQIWFYGQHYSS